jgi:hypothetical protein
MWSSYNEQWHSVLECFFWKSKGRSPAGMTGDVPRRLILRVLIPATTTRGVRVVCQSPGIEAMPPLETLWRPLRSASR